MAVLSITQTGARIELSANIAFNYLKFKYVATQGDRLQVFKVQIGGSPGNSINGAYFQSNLVQFDSSNLPDEVFIAIQISAYVTDSYSNELVILPAISNGNGGGTAVVSAIPFNQLSLVLGSDTLHFNQQSSFSFSSLITLLIHRVNLPTETAVNGMYLASDSTNDLTLSKNTKVASYNNVTVGARQGIMGVIGFYGMIGQELASATVCSASINFTAPATVTLTLNGYNGLYMLLWTGFYVVDCHSSCETCNGVFDHNCLTCPGGFPPVNGKCGCPPHVKLFSNNNTCAPCAAGCVSCTSTFVCTTCQKQKQYRVAVVDSNNRCPCLSGFYENADLVCARCPPSLFCATCELSGTSVVCTSCNCAHYRQNVSGTCACRFGYREDTVTPGPYCLKNP